MDMNPWGPLGPPVSLQQPPTPPQGAGIFAFPNEAPVAKENPDTLEVDIESFLLLSVQ
jgi:hypothetical protein